ncbi:MAG: prepilin-type N-terminal cleavage/methylation domain-containing protein [Candidatus Omnitrophota bacterium]
MNLKRIKNRNGFTLVEVLVAGAILAVISAIMLSFFLQGTNLWQILTGESELRSSARNAMNYMTLELRSATRTSSEIPSPNLTIPSQPNNNSMDFYLPVDMDGNGLIIDALGATEWDHSNRIQYQYVPGLKRLRRLEQGNEYIIADDVASIEFEDNSIDPNLYNDELKIILTLEKVTAQNRTVSVTLASIVKLRNQ